MLAIFISVGSAVHLNAQALKITAANTGIGAANGALLGLGAMGLSNNPDFRYVSVGIGLGTLYGLGVGIYDVYHADPDYGFVPYRGVFHKSDYATAIVLFDTFYGGATGAVVGMAVSLIGGTHIGRGFRYGAGVGLFAGFAFGLADTFILNESRRFEDYNDPDVNIDIEVSTSTSHLLHGHNRNTAPLRPTIGSIPMHHTNGIIQLEDGNRVRAGFIHPGLQLMPVLDSATGNPGKHLIQTLEVAHVKVFF